MAGHYVYSSRETDMLAQGMVIALDYFNLPRNTDPRAARPDGKAVAARATDWGVKWVCSPGAPCIVPVLPFRSIIN